MLRILRLAAVVCVVLTSIAAQGALAIAGGVYEDRMALAVRSHFLPAPNVTVKLYRNDGTLIGTAKTDGEGLYVFRVDAAGDYWVSVDSLSFREKAWAEQTFGPAGARCAQPDGSTRTNFFAGACFGGRTAARSDDPSSLATSEHVALVSVRESANDVDFAFSVDVVTSTADGERVQGSFRQFLANANAIPGANRMRFVPIEAAQPQRETTMGVPPRWWKITFASPLPEVRDDDTIIDATAFNFLSPDSVADVNPGRFGESPILTTETRQIQRQQKPDLELVVNGPVGLVCAATCAMRGVAMHGTPSGIITRANARFEHVVIGAAPDGEPTHDGGTVGLQVENGTTIARYVVASAQSRAGVIVAPKARIDAEHISVTRCGDPLTGGGVILLSDGSAIRASAITINPGAGVVVGAPDGSTPGNGNTIDGSTISGNQAGVVIGPGSSRNVITRNDVMWNRLGGITVAPFADKPPRENRLSANRFDENGLRPIILNLDVENPNQLSAGTDICTRTPTLPNDGIGVPRVTEVRVTDENGMRAIVRGRACPGQIVEIYQSFVTSGIREKKADVPNVRDERIEHETLIPDRRELGFPSIGEFNYLGATNTAADGTFEAVFPLPVVSATVEDAKTIEETNVWATQVMPALDPNDRAFSAIAIDGTGNTSEMSVRRKAD